ncbi:MAG: hypothetical protein K1X53_01040 [Candidatus Sumerlaeaceae bacterium]|nr:hypothetical protein [Candidatus Sumerlaeaceae bacterium]
MATSKLKLSGRAALMFVAALGFLIYSAPQADAAKLVPPGRVLPEHIKRVYVPEFKNLSRGYGLQANLTLYVNDEFMSDGRLDVVQNGRADVRVEGKIKSFKEVVASSSDNIPLISTLEMVCLVELWDPYDTDRLKPIASYTVPAAVQYVSDQRRSIMETDTDGRDKLLRQMARNVVQAIITGAPDPEKAVYKKAAEKYNQRNSPEQFEPVMTKPKYPKPIPADNQ